MSYQAADVWLIEEDRLISAGTWTPPAERRRIEEKVEEINRLTFGEFGATWIATRTKNSQPLKARTTEHYEWLLANWLSPFKNRPLVEISRAEVSDWYHAPGLTTKLTTRQHAYALARSIMKTAIREKRITENPFDIEGAGAHQRAVKVDTFTAAEVAELIALMPDRHKAVVALAAWCGLRFGEICGLRRTDLTEDASGVVRLRVDKGIVSVHNQRLEDTPKSVAGDRVVVVPPEVASLILEHRRNFAAPGRDGLLFPPTNPATKFLTPGQVYGDKPDLRKGSHKRGSGFYLARHLIDRDDLSFHKLRHFYGTTLAVVGATDQELMTSMGHSDLATTQLYQHVAKGRPEELAERIGQLAKLAGQ